MIGGKQSDVPQDKADVKIECKSKGDLDRSPVMNEFEFPTGEPMKIFVERELTIYQSKSSSLLQR